MKLVDSCVDDSKIQDVLCWYPLSTVSCISAEPRLSRVAQDQLHFPQLMNAKPPKSVNTVN